MSTDTREEKFKKVVELVRHNCMELVDDFESLEITHTLTGTSGAIEVCGPSSQIAQIMGSKKKTLSSLQTILFAVASKYGFRVMLNVINRKQRAEFLDEEKPQRTSSRRLQDGPLLVG